MIDSSIRQDGTTSVSYQCKFRDDRRGDRDRVTPCSYKSDGVSLYNPRASHVIDRSQTLDEQSSDVPDTCPTQLCSVHKDASPRSFEMDDHIQEDSIALNQVEAENLRSPGKKRMPTPSKRSYVMS